MRKFVIGYALAVRQVVVGFNVVVAVVQVIIVYAVVVSWGRLSLDILL